METKHLSARDLCAFLGLPWSPNSSLLDLVGAKGNGWIVVSGSFGPGSVHTWNLRPL